MPVKSRLNLNKMSSMVHGQGRMKTAEKMAAKMSGMKKKKSKGKGGRKC